MSRLRPCDRARIAEYDVDRAEFRYRSDGQIAIIVILGACGTGFLAAIIACVQSGNVTVNERPATPAEAVAFVTLFAAIGLCALVAAI
jgi:hypothetical protein